MEIISAVVSSFFFIAFLILLTWKYSNIRIVIIVAAIPRLLLAWLIGLEIVDIQGTVGDAVLYESMARDWSVQPWRELFAQFDTSRSTFVSFVGAIIYKLTIPSPVMLNIFAAFVGVYLVILSYKLSVQFYGIYAAKNVAWVVALFPFAILYSSVYRSEVFFSYFFMLGILFVIKWLKDNNLSCMWAAAAMFCITFFYHGAALAAIPGMALVALMKMFRSRDYFNVPYRKSFSNGVFGFFCATLLLLIGVGGFFSGMEVNKIGNLAELSLGEAIEHRVMTRISDGGSGYPDILRGVDPFSSPFVIPGRFFYFLFSPFFWDISSINHIIGFFASAMFAFIAGNIWVSRRKIWNCFPLLGALIVTLAVLIVFAISIDNIGTSIRHRTKFFYVLVALGGAGLLSWNRVNKKS